LGIPDLSALTTWEYCLAERFVTGYYKQGYKARVTALSSHRIHGNAQIRFAGIGIRKILQQLTILVAGSISKSWLGSIGQCHIIALLKGLIIIILAHFP
jgi:hypothetical protein